MRDSQQKQILLDIKAIADSLQISILLVGAGARILVFDKRYNVEGRVTFDLDLAVKIDNWSTFEVLSLRMTQGTNPLFKVTRIQHRFLHIATGILVDIVPFGAIGKPNQQIQWSDGNQMSIIGLEEAFSTAELQQIEDVEIKVINILAIIALKLMAWSDRKAVKDLKDVYFILENYNDESIFIERINEIPEGFVKSKEVFSFVLGYDIKNTFSQDLVNKINQILIQILHKQNSLFPQLISRIFDEEEWDDKFYTIVAKFEALKQGLEYFSPNER
ncbi:hypothetical protein NIES4071_14510 [Calothrix sp. NIES-4071]|nr:hypothetical protein NIES4071_14510 [Calothrix sp. NIES-4071]BAZ55788.1 hypothetical protein NIES4105_14460 [Calothrix sp. NIES-4105]